MGKRIIRALVALFAVALFIAPATALAAGWPATGTLWVDGQDLMAVEDHTITCSGGGTAQPFRQLKSRRLLLPSAHTMAICCFLTYFL